MESKVKNKDLQWCLNPVLICMGIFGDPGYEPRGKKVFRIILFIVVIFSLILNIFFSVNYTIRFIRDQNRSVSSQSDKSRSLKIPNTVLEWLKNMFQILFVTGVPLIFTVNVYLTGRWRELTKTIQNLDREIRFSSSFYNRCRRCCCSSIFLAFLVSLFQCLYKFNWFLRYYLHCTL